jgi:uncharacterized protein (DUF1499 family)
MRSRALTSLSAFSNVPWVVTFVAAIAIAIVMVMALSLLAIRAPLVEPPGIGVRLGLYLRTNTAQTGAAAVLPELAPLILLGDNKTALHALEQAGRELGWHEVTIDTTNSQLRAVVISAVFRFRDDLYIRLLARGAQRTEALVRSSSRVGRGDLGANVHHIVALRDVLTRRSQLAEDAQ